MGTQVVSESKRLIDRKELRRLVPVSPSQIYRWEKDGLFPKRRQIGPCRVAWSYAEVLEWIECKLEGREWTPATPLRRAANV